MLNTNGIDISSHKATVKGPYRFNFSSGALEPLTTEGKDNLQPGTFLKLNGYNDPEFVIIKKLENKNYLVVDVDDMHQQQQQPHSLDFLSQKKTGGIQMYINDLKPAMTLDDVNDIFQRSESKRIEQENETAKAAAERKQIIEKGKILFEAKRPEWAKAAIIAVNEINDCNMMEDYFATKTGGRYILAWSAHTRDIFSEMRKAATNSGLKEIEHLGIGKGVFKPRVVVCETFQSNGAYYHKGGYSNWHKNLEEVKTCTKAEFHTKAEAENFIAGKTPEPIQFDDQLINFEWKIEEDGIEHREKYSMGAGYYLKSGSRYDTGWKIEKLPLSYNLEDLYFAAGSGRFVVPEDKPKKKAAQPAHPIEAATIPGPDAEKITVKENEEKNGVEIYFPSKPAAEIREDLKANGFRWSGFSGCWYTKRTAESLEYVKRFSSAERLENGLIKDDMTAIFGTPETITEEPETILEAEIISDLEPEILIEAELIEELPQEPEIIEPVGVAAIPEPEPAPLKAHTMQLIKQIKEENQDFEWYPTTPEIISTIKRCCGENDSVLDCGAGDGRVLTQLTKGKQYAIEKSVPLIQAMPPEIIIVGTEFFQSTLIDKPVDIVFSNPPYSEFESWATKIISEAHATKIFLVLPSRWKDNQGILDAIKKRDARARSIGSFDFLSADRAARATVDILQITLDTKGYGSRKSDPFDAWFDSEFDFKKGHTGPNDAGSDVKTSLKDKLKNAVVEGRGKVPVMVELYNHEMQHLYENFKQIAALDADLLKELGTGKHTICEALKSKITGLKKKYWKELFDNLDDITNRLTSKSRKTMLDKLTAQTNVDFTETNIYAVLIWVIKNANKYYDDQLIDIVEDMITKANIVNYKSNQRVYKFDEWRYRDEKKEASHYGLELRIVLQRWKAIFNADYGRYDWPENLHTTAHEFINDLRTIAKNLNFDLTPGDSHSDGEWESNTAKNFYIIINQNKTKPLMSVKAFKNGNLHFKFNQSFIKRLNVEFGRLKGWLKNAQQAAEELNIPVKEASEFFRSNRQLTVSNIRLLAEK